GELGGYACFIPVLPGLDKAAVFDTGDGDAGGDGALAGAFVNGREVPADADQVAFCDSDSRLDADVVELVADAVVKSGEFLRATDGSVAFVEDAFLVKEIEDGLAAGLVPDFVEPAANKLFIVFEGGDGFGGHGYLRRQVDWSIPSSHVG